VLDNTDSAIGYINQERFIEDSCCVADCCSYISASSMATIFNGDNDTPFVCDLYLFKNDTLVLKEKYKRF